MNQDNRTIDQAIQIAATTFSTQLSDWQQAIRSTYQNGQPQEAAELANIVLHHWPMHLATYQQMLQITWELERWSEGADWARRILRSDPGNALAWRSLARAAEETQERAPASAIWQRAFEAQPYDSAVRTGLSRTTLDHADALGLNLACLASVRLRSRCWRHASALYHHLVQSESRRSDFQVGYMVSLWQQGATEEAYRWARHLSTNNRHLIMPWFVLNETGDENDQALAQHPISIMDPDRTFLRNWLGLSWQAEDVVDAPASSEDDEEVEVPVTFEVELDDFVLLETAELALGL